MERRIKEVRAKPFVSDLRLTSLSCLFKERHSRMGVDYLNPHRVLVVAQRQNA